MNNRPKKGHKKSLQTQNRFGECLTLSMAKQPTKILFFYMVGVRLKTLLNKIEPTNCDFSQVHRLCVFASGSLITVMCNSLTSINISFLHFGQNSGKFIKTVFFRNFILVLFGQIGHNSQ